MTFFGIFDTPEGKKRIEKIKNSMHAISDLRVSAFLPIEKINKNSKLYKEFINNGNVLIRETSWGKIEIRNKLLTQYHLDILTAIILNTNIFFNPEGELMSYFTLFKLSQILGIRWGTRTKENLKKALKEIADIRINREDKQGNFVNYTFISSIEHLSTLESIMKVKFTKEFIDFFLKELTINYPETFKKLRELKKLLIQEKNTETTETRGIGLLKAIINFFITQQQGQKIELLKLLETIGYPATERQIRRAKEIINKNIEILEKEFNIKYDKKKKIFEYTKKLEDIEFIPAIPIKKEQ